MPSFPYAQHEQRGIVSNVTTGIQHTRLYIASCLRTSYVGFGMANISLWIACNRAKGPNTSTTETINAIQRYTIF